MPTRSPALLVASAALLMSAFAGPAGADRYYRLVRDGRTIGFFQVTDERTESYEGRPARVRQTRLVVLATYVGSSELHSVRESLHHDAATGALLAYRVDYRQGKEEESRLAVFRQGRAVLRILAPDREPQERRAEVPAGAFVHTGYLGLAELVAGASRGGRTFQVFDPKTLETRAGALEPPADETIDVQGRPMASQRSRFRAGETSMTLWIAAGNRELLRVREDGAAGVDLVLADERVVREVEGIDVSAPPLARRRDLPWELDRSYQYDFLVGGKVVGWVKFTPTVMTIHGKRILAVTSKIDLESGNRRWTSSSATHYDAETLSPEYFEFDGVEFRPDRKIETSLDVTFREGRVGVVFQKDNQILENRQPIPPGCQLVHNNNVEQFAVFLSQIDLERGQTTKVNVYHPRLFQGFVVEVVAGATRTVDGRSVVEARLESETIKGQILLDANGRLLSYGRDDWEFRLVE